MLQLKEYELRNLLRDFYTLTRIRIVVFDAEMQEVLSYPEAPVHFCSILRQDPGMNHQCMKSDLSACAQCARTGNVVTYRCHAGLTETVVPIQDEYGVIGYLMFGQVLPSRGAEATRKQILKALPESLFPGITDAVAQIPQITDEEISAAATILQILTTYVHSSRLVVLRNDSFPRQLEDYIVHHLSRTITAEDLCREFRISRSRLYALSEQYLEMGVAEYIRHARIRQAGKLLTTTDRSITDIANATGFADYTHFSRVFRQITGMSARQYRSKHKNH